MKTINLHNYEEYAIDYMLGNLTTNQAEEFAAFLAMHPNIANDILLFETKKQELSLQKEPEFNHLKKDINKIKITDSNFEEFCIAYAEGDLNEIATKQLTAYIGENDHLKNELKSYFSLKLKAENIIFPNKESLKKKEHKSLFTRHLWHISTAISAAVILLFFWVFPLHENIKAPTTELAMTSSFKEFVLPPKTPKTQTTISDIIVITPTKKIDQQAEKLLAQQNENTPNIIKEKHHLLEVNKDNLPTTVEPLKLLKKKRITINTHEKITLPMIALVTATENNTLVTPTNNLDDFKTKASNYIYTKVLTKGIESINKMAETSLEYKIIEDPNGQAVRIKFSTQLGEINHTLAQR